MSIVITIDGDTLISPAVSQKLDIILKRLHTMAETQDKIASDLADLAKREGLEAATLDQIKAAVSTLLGPLQAENANLKTQLQAINTADAASESALQAALASQDAVSKQASDILAALSPTSGQ